MTGPVRRSGLFSSLRRLLSTALGLAQVRLELFGTELEQEKRRLFDALLKAAIAFLLLGLAMVLGIAFVILLFQEGYRLAAVGVLTLVFAAAGVWLMRWAREDLRASDEGAFALSLGELRRDRAALSDAPPATPDPPSRPQS